MKLSSRHRVVRRVVALAGVAVLVLAACGGDDEESGDETATTEVDSASTTGSDDENQSDSASTTPESDSSEPETSASETSESDSGGSDGDAASGSIEEQCAQLVTLDEAEALIGEATEFAGDESSRDDDLGQTLCVWGTIEDPADTDDLASQSIILQHYDGTISGQSFYDPAMQFPDAEPLDIGDEGVIEVTDAGVDIAFVSGDTATFLSWFSIDMSGAEGGPTGESQRDAVVAMAQLVDERTQ